MSAEQPAVAAATGMSHERLMTAGIIAAAALVLVALRLGFKP